MLRVPMPRLSAALLLSFAAAHAACTGRPGGSESSLPPVETLVLTPQSSGVDVLLIAAHAVDAETVWAAGRDGTVLRTTDGGATWARTATPPGADSLQLRDVHAFDARTAVALSIGSGDDSRVFRTADGGATWATAFVNAEPEGFYDCLDFWDRDRGVLYGDSVDGGLRVLTTADGGRSWTRVPDDRLPAALPGEGGFAASGTCALTGPDAPEGQAWIATGNADPARVLRSTDSGQTWRAAVAPVVGGEARGLTSVARDADGRLVAVGGDIARPDTSVASVAVSDDGGRTWRAGGRLPFSGAAYGVAALAEPGGWIAVGPGGVGLSTTGGASWTLQDDREHWGLAVAGGEGWLVGPGGRITHVTLYTSR